MPGCSVRVMFSGPSNNESSAGVIVIVAAGDAGVNVTEPLSDGV